MKKAFVIINKQHRLSPEQEALLRELFKEIEYVEVPATGWSLEEMKRVAEDIHYRAAEAEVFRNPKTGDVVATNYPSKGENAVVFAEPIPKFLLKELWIRSMFSEYRSDFAVAEKRYRYLYHVVLLEELEELQKN